uniref:Uncharacterized protein n=1 Tax=Romanomermis culicivorax TaxID=13658 RepID=A0A915KA68_ROMCU
MTSPAPLCAAEDPFGHPGFHFDLELQLRLATPCAMTTELVRLKDDCIECPNPQKINPAEGVLAMKIPAFHYTIYDWHEDS